jgi:dipeptidyl aminopeptidase/acylaminoacyl peptidase
MIDAQIACDYIAKRKDLDAERIAFAGVSWGGFVAPYILAIDERIKLGILILFGVQSRDEYPWYDQINYLPRVKIPMLLLAGRYDPDYSLKQQQAFYDFLGTPENEKEWKIYESTHYIPRKDAINESLNWLDKYFGPVNK